MNISTSSFTSIRTRLRALECGNGRDALDKDGAILAPLVIGELVKDSEKRWRYIRLASRGRR